MEIKILSPEPVDFKEKQVQEAFERDLSSLEEGLLRIDSEVIIGTGRIDTLAFDTETSRPVFIEYKRRGEFGRDALIQLMDYLSWFARDENRMAILEKAIHQRKPDLEDFDPSIRLICVVSEIDDRVRNAIYAISNHVKIYSYLVARDTANNVILVPKLEVDNAEIEPPVREPISEVDLLKKHANLRNIFNNLRTVLESDGARGYATGRSFRFKRERVFAKIHFRKKYLQLELRVGRGTVDDADFKYWRQGESSWGYTYVYPTSEVSAKVRAWIELAKEYVREFEEDDESENELSQ